jgi:hypothetical protein
MNLKSEAIYHLARQRATRTKAKLERSNYR